jgi:hypothetical protein
MPSLPFESWPKCSPCSLNGSANRTRSGLLETLNSSTMHPIRPHLPDEPWLQSPSKIHTVSWLPFVIAHKQSSRSGLNGEGLRMHGPRW